MEATKRYREKMNDVLRCLAVREGDVRERLVGAYRYLRMLRLAEVPVSHREEFMSILDACTRYGPELGPEGEVWVPSVKHTMQKIRNSTGRRLAEQLYQLARDLD